MTIEQRRKKVAAMVRADKSEREIAAALGVSRSTVWNDKRVLDTRLLASMAQPR